MEELIEAERDSGIDDKPRKKRKKRPKRKPTDDNSDADDVNFLESELDEDGTSDSDDSDCVEITNEEVSSLLNAHSSPIMYQSITASWYPSFQNNAFWCSADQVDDN